MENRRCALLIFAAVLLFEVTMYGLRSDPPSFGPAPAEAVVVSTQTLQSAAGGNGNGTVVPTQAYTTVVIQTAGTFSATVNFEASIDKTTWFAIQCVSVSDRTDFKTTATAAGAVRCNLIGMNAIRARISGYASGTVTVTAGLASAGVF